MRNPPRSTGANDIRSVALPLHRPRAVIRRTRTYVALTAGLLVECLFIGQLPWHGSNELHTMMELTAAFTALAVGVAALLRYYSKKNYAHLYIGAGFIGTALLDGYHGVVTASVFHSWSPAPPPSLIPWSWSISRIFLSIVVVMSLRDWCLERSPRPAGVAREGAVYGIVAALMLIGIAFCALAPLPPARYSHLFLERPQELIPALLFLVALVGYIRKGAWKSDPFEHWLVISLIVGTVGQAVLMTRSVRPFDAMCDAGHLIKIVSYACVLVGLLISTYKLFHQAESCTSELKLMNNSLKVEVDRRCEAERQLKDINSSLESAVAERTVELEQQRMAALNMMQDAQVAKRASDQVSERLRQSEADLTRTVAQLSSSNHELEEFAYVASHDLQEPLRTVTSYVQLIERRYAGKLDDEGREFIEYIVDATSRMKQLINDLLKLSRVDSKGRELEPTDCGRVLEQVLASLECAIDETGAEVTHDRLPTVMADGIQLGQLLQNLIGNAMKFHGENAPHVHVTADRRKDEWCFSVRDNGIGIAPEYGERIFRIFQRLHSRSEYSGSGIGLAVCKKIVERHGGRIWMESLAGEGTTFFFTIPGKKELDHHDMGVEHLAGRSLAGGRQPV